MTAPEVAVVLEPLPREQADRPVELAALPADEDVPGVIVELLWAASPGFRTSVIVSTIPVG